jgi:predicted small lipoprotein YifL
MGSQALAPPLTLHAPSRTTIWVVLAIAAVLALAAAGLVLALELPAGQPTAPAHFQGNS